jgi:hypothetical protein
MATRYQAIDESAAYSDRHLRVLKEAWDRQRAKQEAETRRVADDQPKSDQIP